MTSSGSSAATPPRTKITAKIADSLSKMRMSADMDAHFDQISAQIARSNHNDESDESDESELELNYTLKSSKIVSSAKKVNGAISTSASFSASKSASNEIWLEYGCI